MARPERCHENEHDDWRLRSAPEHDARRTTPATALTFVRRDFDENSTVGLPVRAAQTRSRQDLTSLESPEVRRDGQLALTAIRRDEMPAAGEHGGRHVQEVQGAAAQSRRVLPATHLTPPGLRAKYAP